MAQLGGPVRAVEGSRQQRDVRAVDAQAAVDHAGAALRNSAPYSRTVPRVTRSVNFVAPAECRTTRSRDPVLSDRAVGSGLDDAEFLVVRFDRERAAVGLPQERDFDDRCGGPSVSNARPRRWSRGSSRRPTRASRPSTARCRRCRSSSLRRFHLDAAVVVPGPRPRDQHESAAAVAELLLQHRAGIGGDQIAGGGRIAVVHDAGGAALEQRCVEMIERVRRVDQIRWRRTSRRLDRRSTSSGSGASVSISGSGDRRRWQQLRIERREVLERGRQRGRNSRPMNPRMVRLVLIGIAIVTASQICIYACQNAARPDVAHDHRAGGHFSVRYERSLKVAPAR